ncbi:MAG TPA: HD domain-containing phosphohydrolase [Pseudobacteroides sp.]|uniref:HD-GYP domain-containing protein n=1 Tax=Pseudobacteroides sp. TaxID=1968840 RepID=UPI002F95EDEB
MRVVNISNLKGDEKIGKQVFDNTGRILLNAGTKLSQFSIDKLISLGIQSVYIDDEISKEVVIDEAVSENIRQMGKYALKETMEKYSKIGTSDNSDIVKAVNSIIDEVFSNKNTLVNATEIRTCCNSVFSHSVNVCVLSSLVGIHMGYNMLKLKDIALGAILHDIGKIIIQNDKKTLLEFNSKKDSDIYIESMHPKIGHDFLGRENFCSTHSKMAVLMHHEKVDGTGYPLKLKGNDINEIAKLVSVCNTFVNLISGKGNEPSKSVNEAVKQISQMSGYSFDDTIVKTLTMNVATYPSGTGVVLNTNESGLVLRQNLSMPLRPVVKVLLDKAGEPIAEPYEMDLLKESNILIKGNCEL